VDGDAHWRTAGDRIQTLLDGAAAGGPVARERAEQLVREVVELYGAALSRVVQIAAEHDPAVVEVCATDDLVASLMLVHNLHPHDVHRRVADALDSVRPYLGSHGGDVELLEITGTTARLKFAGSCQSCPSSAVTLELTVEDAVRSAAPEIISIEVVAAEPSTASTVIPADSLLSRVHSSAHAGARWHPAPDLADLQTGEVGGFVIAGTAVLACRIGDELFAYHDRCGSCDASLAGAALHRRMGAAISGPVLRCPRCRAHFDVRHAGAGLDDSAGPDAHLDPIPLLVRDGVLSMAVLATPSTVP
jgi:Fe-S cluster biogenesis protein NfuA/nitrite reductase/ring-hydroxylating ferredoxin subunit